VSASPISPNEAALLRAAGDDWFAVAAAASAAGLREDQAMPAAEALVARELLARREEVARRLVIGEAGRAQAEGGVPELRIRRRVADAGGEASVQEAQDVGLPKPVVGSAFGGLKKAGLIGVAGGRVTVADDPAWKVHEGRQALLEDLAGRGDGALPWEEVPEALRDDVEARLPGKRSKKGEAPFELVEERRREYRLTDEGARARAGLGEARPQVARLTPEMLKDGSWRDVEFRAFHIAEPAAPSVGRRNPYRAFLDETKRKLLGLGFEEMTGSLVEPEFWNMDALFLPQFHPAREIHDVYMVEDAESPGAFRYAREIEGGALEPVALEHEGEGRTGSRGWLYDFDRERTKRLVLRSQGTALSARWLQRAKRPGKYFAMARCFRYDTVDATHAPDFFQVEGIVHSEQTSFRHLLGLLRIFAQEMARAEELRFVPGYFPFTEPSVEVHMKHPVLGWIELGGAGIFRPEVTEPHGLEAPVIAWGLGLDRMAMVALGIDDIRHLFTNNLPDGLGGLRAASAQAGPPAVRGA